MTKDIFGKGTFQGKPTIAGEEGEGILIRPARLEGQGDAEEGDALSLPSEVAVLPLPDVVVLPGAVAGVKIVREKDQRLLDSVLPDQKVVAVVCQKDPTVENPAPEDLYEYGAAAAILKLLRLEEGVQHIVLQGLARVRLSEYTSAEPYLSAKITVLEDQGGEGTESEALILNASNLARRIIELSPNIADEAVMILNNIDQAGMLADFLAAHLSLDIPTRIKLLGEVNVDRRLRLVTQELQHQLEVVELSNKIQSQVKENIDKSQREYYLQEQLKAIQKELGQVDDKTVEIQQIREGIEAAGMPENVRTEAVRELSRLEKIPAISPEYHVIRTYLDWITELPWSKSTQDNLDIERAGKILNEDHYDLDKVKRRILEYLAVRKLAPESRGPILCFVGPPGVGKTSLGQSIARALGRKFIRMSLGGMRDEAELRGHRRTYIGAMPGRIIQEIRKAGTCNPVFMLDELDKVGADFRGDPTSALLEILDPAQNDSFQDHYLNVPFDLSRVLLIGTANYMAPVPPALRDRMEIIELPGYTQSEKLHIAMKYLVPRQLEQNGLRPTQAKWQEAAVNRIIESYTREAGVRELERQIGSVCRAITALIAAEKARSRTITPKRVAEILGPRKYESELAMRTSVPGVATGLAWTPTGGEIIFVEAATYPGKGNLILTGQIGDVMKESVQAAYSLIKSRARQLGLDESGLAHKDIHVHVPAGAVPKDGPSAGVAMFTALISLLTGRRVRKEVAMTGEITLRGLVLPVGGVKEKCLAAKRAGIKTIILPERNRRDLEDVPAEAKKQLQFRLAKTVDDVLDEALDHSGPRSRAGRGRKSKS